MLLTLDELKESGACEKSVKRFRRIFGESVEVNDDTVGRVAPFFEWDCAATKLLNEDQEEVYERLVEPAFIVYERDGNYKNYLIAASKAWLAARRA